MIIHHQLLLQPQSSLQPQPQPLLLYPPASRISMIIHHQLLPLQKLHIMLSSLLFDPMGNSKIYYSFGSKGVHVQQHDIAWQNI